MVAAAAELGCLAAAAALLPLLLCSRCARWYCCTSKGSLWKGSFERVAHEEVPAPLLTLELLLPLLLVLVLMLAAVVLLVLLLPLSSRPRSIISKRATGRRHDDDDGEANRCEVVEHPLPGALRAPLLPSAAAVTHFAAAPAAAAAAAAPTVEWLVGGAVSKGCGLLRG